MPPPKHHKHSSFHTIPFLISVPFSLFSFFVFLFDSLLPLISTVSLLSSLLPLHLHRLCSSPSSPPSLFFHFFSTGSLFLQPLLFFLCNENRSLLLQVGTFFFSTVAPADWGTPLDADRSLLLQIGAGRLVPLQIRVISPPPL
ncbi:sensor histidine kinase [Sesbania bispinosa]|nr:sensor histidine kinase [Sesbania bispinosa]